MRQYGPPIFEAVSYFQIFAKQLRSAAAGGKPPCPIRIPVEGYLVVVRLLHPRCICAWVLCSSLGPPGTKMFSCTQPTRLCLTLDESALADNRGLLSTKGIRGGVSLAQRRRWLTISFEMRREYRARRISAPACAPIARCTTCRPAWAITAYSRASAGTTRSIRCCAISCTSIRELTRSSSRS
jgi:hypothetical protein